MEVYIDGRQLHINNGDITLNWANIRFSEAVADEWSTEIELPNDNYNIDLLNCYGLLDRGAVYNHKINCAVLVDDATKDGYLQILSIDENTIKARVYILSIPYAVLDKKVSDYYPHDDIVFRWDRFSPITTNIAGVDEGIIPYDYTQTDFYSNILAQWHASVSVGKILQNIQTAEDITLPAVNNTLFQVATQKKVCPSNPFQVMMGYFEHTGAIADKDLEVSCGQHITNDAITSWSYTDFEWDAGFTDWVLQTTSLQWLTNSAKVDKITFNRDCTAHIKIYACANKTGGILIPKRNGEDLAPANASAVPVLSSSTWDVDDILLFDDYVSFTKDDVFTLHYSGSAQLGGRRAHYTVVVEYENYEWNGDDYNTDLEYIPAPFVIWALYESGGVLEYLPEKDFDGTGDGTHGAADYSFTYFGAYSNLDRDLTVREYITSLCWVHNQKLHLDRNELIFQNANTKDEITANITQISPATDKLAQTNKIGYRGLESGTEFEIDNEFLNAETTLHENAFMTADVLPQYNYEMTYSDPDNGEGWITDINVNFEDLGAVIMTATPDGGGRYTLEKAPDIIGFGLPAMSNAQTITAQTLTDIRDTDYVSIDGHKYMVVDGNTDLNTYITEFNAIQCDSVFNTIPTVVINAIYTSYTTADVEYTVTGIFIQTTTLTIYSDSALTQVVMVIDGTAADTQLINVTGLTPNTYYWALVTATDAQGNEGTSQPEMFRTVLYTFSGDVEFTQDYATLQALVNVTCQGATFTETGIQFSTTPDFSGNIITGSNTTPPADSFSGDVAGFAANTLYYYRFYAVSDYGTQYYTPLFNEITTMYAPPVLSITEVESTPFSLTLSFLYSGDYPYEGYYNCAIGRADGTGTPIDINLDRLHANTPKVVTIPNLAVGCEYVVTWDVEYYHNEVSTIQYFITQAHNFDFETTVDRVTDTTVQITTSATKITPVHVNLENIGLNLRDNQNFNDNGRDLGGALGYGDLSYRLRKTDLTPNTTYYYRPWILTREFGTEYGEIGSFTTLFSMPTVTLTELSHSYDTITVNLNYSGDYPVPANGVLSLYLNGVELQRLNASVLRPNDDTVFTFTNLDELTTYTITYSGDYYNQLNAISDTITATTGERINITHVATWAANGQCTHTITVNSYEAIDTFTITFNDPNITMVSPWTLNGLTIEGVSQGYYYYNNPYSLDVEVTIGGGYTVIRNFPFSVPTDGLRVIDTFGHMYPPYIKKQLNGNIFKRTGGRTQFLIDVQNTSLTLVERTTGYECSASCNGVDYQVDSLNNRLLTAMQYYPAGEYRAKWTVTNIMGQTLTEFDLYNSNIIVYGAIFLNVQKTADSIKFDVRWNMWGGYTQTKRVDLVLNERIMESLTLTPDVDYNSNIQFTNLFAGMDYTVRAYYDTNSVTNYVGYNYTTPIDYLNFSMPNGGTVTLIRNGTPTEVTLEYSLDNGDTWAEWIETENVRSLTLAAGQTMHLRNTSETNTGFSTGSSTTDIYRFSFSANTYAGGNTNSLLCKNPQNAVITENCFNRLFLNTKLVTAPALPSTEIARGCYNYTFRECRFLESAPEVLPATTTYPYCYYYMFEGCTSLVKASKILAESIASYACGGMFRNDTALNYIYTAMNEISAQTSIANWVDGVAANGDFYCPAELTIPTGSSGIPSGWTRHDI